MAGRHAFDREATLSAVNTPAGRGVATAVAVGAIFGVIVPGAAADEQAPSGAKAAALDASQAEAPQATEAVTASADAEWNVEQVEVQSATTGSDVAISATVSVPAARTATANGNAFTAEANSGSNAAVAVNALNTSSSSSSVFGTAMSYVGAPYVSRGTSPSGWDCIGFVRYVYAQHGVAIGGSPSSVLSVGHRVAYADAQPGDILYWPGHVGIYAGKGQNVAAWNSGMDTRVGPNSWVGGTPVVIRVFG